MLNLALDFTNASYDLYMIRLYQKFVKDGKLSITEDQNLQSLAFISQLNVTSLELIRCYNIVVDLSDLKNIQHLRLKTCRQKKALWALWAFNSPTLKSLDLEDNTVSNISPLDVKTNLKTLKLRSNRITNIRILSKLTNIVELDLSHNSVNITLLNSLKSVRSLNLCYVGLRDAGYIAGLVDLVELDVSDNKYLYIDSMCTLVNIEKLNMSKCELSDIEVIRNMPKLTWLDISLNTSVNLQSLNGLNLTYLNINECRAAYNGSNVLNTLCNLQELDLSNNANINLDDISQLTKLVIIKLENTNLKTTELLVKHETLQEVDISQNIDINIDTLHNLKHLTKLNAQLCGIKQADNLQNLIELTQLNLQNNAIISTKFINKMTQLTKLDLSNCNIDDITFIQHLQNLTELDLSCNIKLQNLQPLKKLKKLTKLQLNGNKIKDIWVLRYLTNIEELGLMHNKIIDILPLQYLKKMQKLSINTNQVQSFNCLLHQGCLTYQGTGSQKQPKPLDVQISVKAKYVNFIQDRHHTLFRQRHTIFHKRYNKSTVYVKSKVQKALYNLIHLTQKVVELLNANQDYYL
ncbi:Conserved_hypothetical protein [Hexamita inflata]|uniref:Uncharacterized protein n=1 Tax=Hexamita inflata TaxID=28002 RepID=A0ABP1GJT6_9EUKA